MTKETKPLQVGDRVRVYGFDPECSSKGLTRKLIHKMDDGTWLTDVGEYAHPKQCRKLVKKPRQEFFVAPGGKGCPYIRGLCLVGEHGCYEKNGCVKVREVKKS